MPAEPADDALQLRRPPSRRPGRRPAPRPRASRRRSPRASPPSCSVWSSPTLVSATTGRVEHVGRVVPAAQPGLDHHDLGADCGQGDERRRRQHLELRQRLVGRRVDRRAAACSTRADGRRQHLLAERRARHLHALRGTRARAARCTRRRRGRAPAGWRRRTASSTSCRSCRRRGSRGTRRCGSPSAVEQQPHALEPEPHPERGAGREQVLEPGHLPRQLGQARLEALDFSRPKRSARSRSSATTAAGARSTKRALASLACALASRRSLPRPGASSLPRSATARAPPPTSTRASPTTTGTPAGGLAPRRSPGRGRPAGQRCARRCAASSPPETASSSGSRGPRPASWRMRRSSVTQLDHRRHGARRLGVLGHVRHREGATASAARARRAGTARSPRSRTASPGAAGASTRSSTNSAVSDAWRRATAIVAVEPDLERLEVPVADVVPDEAVQLLDEVRELEGLVLRRRDPRRPRSAASGSSGRSARRRRRRDRRPDRRRAARAARRSRACS